MAGKENGARKMAGKEDCTIGNLAGI